MARSWSCYDQRSFSNEPRQWSFPNEPVDFTLSVHLHTSTITADDPGKVLAVTCMENINLITSSSIWPIKICVILCLEIWKYTCLYNIRKIELFLSSNHSWPHSSLEEKLLMIHHSQFTAIGTISQRINRDINISRHLKGKGETESTRHIFSKA